MRRRGARGEGARAATHLVPRSDLVRVERQLADRLVLRRPPLVTAHEEPREEGRVVLMAATGVREAERVGQLRQLGGREARKVRGERGGGVDGREIGEREVGEAHLEGGALEGLCGG